MLIPLDKKKKKKPVLVSHHFWSFITFWLLTGLFASIIHRMQFFIFYVLLISLLPFALAQFGYDFGPTKSSPFDQPSKSAASKEKSEVHIINVGKNGPSFEPNSLSAPVGDIVEFHFWSGTHSVAQSADYYPCTPRTRGMFEDFGAFYSGPITVASDEGPRKFRIQVNGTGPIWFYCAVDRHCQEGMVGVINE